MAEAASLFSLPGVVADPADELAPFRTLVLDVATQAALDEVVAHDRFAEVGMALMAGWGPHAEDDAAMTRTLRDVGHYMAGVWSLALAGSSDGLSHASLTRLFEPLGLGSRTRAHALIAYFRTRGMIRPAEQSGDGRVRRYEVMPALRQLFHNRFRRELATAAPLVPPVTGLLDCWDDPGAFEAFMVANGQFMIGSYLAFDKDAANLDVFAHRNAGLTILGQVMLTAPPSDEFPPTGPTDINLMDVARRSAVSRAHARNVIRAGETAGFFLRRADGLTGFSPDLRHQLTYLLAAYVLSLAWCARQVMDRGTA